MTEPTKPWHEFRDAMAQFEQMPGMDAYRFLRRLQFAFVVLAGNAADFRSCIAHYTSSEIAPKVFRYGARESHELAFLTVSRVLHNLLSSAYSVSEIVDTQIRQRERQATKWGAVRAPLVIFLSAVETELLYAIRAHAVHVDTLDAGFTRTFVEDSDKWTLQIQRPPAPRKLGHAARARFEAWGDRIDIIGLVEPFLRTAEHLHRSVLAVVNHEFRAELDDLMARQRHLKATYPNYFAD